MGTTSSCASCEAERDEESRRLRAARDGHIAQQNTVTASDGRRVMLNLSWLRTNFYRYMVPLGLVADRGPDTLAAFVRNSEGCEDTHPRIRSRQLPILRCTF